MIKRTACVPLLTLCSLFPMAHANDAVTPIDHCGFTITQPGNYHITQDLVCSLGDAITIAANDVEVHFDGHTLTGVGNRAGNGIGAFNRSNISIFGEGTIVGFSNTQINFFGVANSRIVNMAANNGSGLFGSGINLQASVNNTITNCTANDNPDLGIAVGGGSGNTLTSNTANRNGGSLYGQGGIMVFQSADNVLLANRTESNIGPGIIVIQSPFSVGNLFQANQASSNSPVDLFEGNGCGTNTWKSNHNGTANLSCIQ